MSQHVAIGWPNARNMLHPTVLRYVALASCDRLAGALESTCHDPTFLYSPLDIETKHLRAKSHQLRWLGSIISAMFSLCIFKSGSPFPNPDKKAMIVHNGSFVNARGRDEI